MSISDLYYRECSLGRMPIERSDTAWLATHWQHHQTRIIHFWQGKWLALVEHQRCQPASLRADALNDESHQFTRVLLGMQQGVAWFAVDHRDLTALPELCAQSRADVARSARKGGGVGSRFGSDLGLCPRVVALAQSAWILWSLRCTHRAQHGGHMRQCTATDCQKEHFVRIEPAVIVLVVDEHTNLRVACWPVIAGPKGRALALWPASLKSAKA